MGDDSYKALKNYVKELEQKLAQKEDDLNKRKLIIENLSEGIWIIDEHAYTTFVNKRLADMLGYTEEEMMGQHLYSFMDSRGRELSKKRIGARQILESEQHDFEFLRKDGSRIDVLLETSPLRDSEGNYRGAIAGILNISKRKKAEEALRESEERWRSVTEHSPDHIMLIDKELKIVFINRTVPDLTKDEVLGKPVLNFLSPEFQEIALKSFRKVFDTGKPDIYEVEYKRKDDGGSIYFETSLGPIFKDGEVVALTSSSRDITERKLIDEQLRMRQRMDSLVTLSGGIAHDFNNILVGIMGYIDLLNYNSENLSDEQRKLVESSLTSCYRARDLIQQFRSFSTKWDSAKSRIDVHTIATEVFNFLEKTTDKLIRKKINFPEETFFIYANATELYQVFMNLSMNAIQAIEERGVKRNDSIQISAERYIADDSGNTRLPDGEYVHIRFEDSGIGMSKSTIEKAFDPLFTTKEKGGRRGQGLGLAIVYNIVTRIQNGQILIDSQKNRGTVFNVYLPLHNLEIQDSEENVQEVVGGSETILIVDDEKTVREIGKAALTRFGYNVLTADGGKKALSMYRDQRNTIDLVVLDLVMPKLSGQMVFQKLLEHDPDVKVIISSGHSSGHANKGVITKAKGNLSKPYKIEDLARSVRNALDS